MMKSSNENLEQELLRLTRHPSSFRDPDGTIFCWEGQIFRQINHSYKFNYDALISTGLYEELTRKKFLIDHSEVMAPPLHPETCFKVIRPSAIDFISHPYEWSFSQLKDAAILTLDIELLALNRGMTLKDASAYNIQFQKGRPIFVDTLSFEVYQKGRPWGAYRQFCQHFLAPLALMAKTDLRLLQFLRIFIDGVPLELASRLLPKSTYLNWGLVAHIHIHSKMQKFYGDVGVTVADGRVKSPGQLSARGKLGLISSLRNAVENLRCKTFGMEWENYYEETNYSNDSLRSKAEILDTLLDSAEPSSLWDLGSNSGMFSRVAASKGINTIAFDIDPGAVEACYLLVREQRETKLLPLLIDITNPSAAIGWGNAERQSLSSRAPVDCIMALALIHHLAIGNNVPFALIAEYFASLSKDLIIEWVPKEDSQVKRMLNTRRDVFEDYSEFAFERDFGSFFEFRKKNDIPGTKRALYWMRRR